MAGGNYQGDPQITGINMTPFVDVMLVLLVIFIVTAKIVVAPAVPVDLPSASTAVATAVVLPVVVTATGQLAVGADLMGNDQQLVKRVSAAVTADPAIRVVVQADGRASHAVVMHVLDLLGQAGVRNVAFGASGDQAP